MVLFIFKHLIFYYLFITQQYISIYNIDGNILSVQQRASYMNLALVGLSVHFKDYGVCYNTLYMISLITPKYQDDLQPALINTIINAINENIQYPDICFIGCQILENVMNTISPKENQAFINVMIRMFRTHLGVPFMVKKVIKILNSALRGDPVSQSTAFKTLLPYSLIDAIKKHMTNPQIVSSCCVTLSILFSLPSLYSKYFTQNLADTIEDMEETTTGPLKNTFSILIKSLTGEENEHVKATAKRGLCTNYCLEKGVWIQQKMYRCLTCKTKSIFCEGCRRSCHENHDCIKFFYVGRCSSYVKRKK